MKTPSANTMVSTMTPMISSPNRSRRRETSAEPMPQGNISRATAGNARMEINASLTGRITNHLPAMCDCSVPVLIRCQDSSARRSQLSHFGHWDAATAPLLPGKWHPAADGTHDGCGKRVPMEMGPIGERGGPGPRTAVIVFAACRRVDRTQFGNRPRRTRLPALARSRINPARNP